MSLTPAQMDVKIANDPTFAVLVHALGIPVAIVDCTTGGHQGEICMESNCVNGKKLVMKCDQSNGCTDYEVVRCPDTSPATTGAQLVAPTRTRRQTRRQRG